MLMPFRLRVVYSPCKILGVVQEFFFFFNFLESHSFPMKAIEIIIKACSGLPYSTLDFFDCCGSKEVLAGRVEVIASI